MTNPRLRSARLLPVLLLLGLSACEEGGSWSAGGDLVVSEPPPPNPVITLSDELIPLVRAAAPSGSLEYYQLPSSDDFDAIPQDPMNPLTAEKVALGQFLFHDPVFGTAGVTGQSQTWSCATCHHARAGFKSGIIQGLGEGGEGFGQHGNTRVLAAGLAGEEADVQPVTSPSALNIAYQEVVLWNGQFGNAINGLVNVGVDPDRLLTPGTPKEVNGEQLAGVETQAIAGTDVHRMAMGAGTPLQTNAEYLALFEAAYPDSDEFARGAALAIAAYERTLLANQAPFQRWLAGDNEAMTEAQLRGAKVFFGDGGCTGCHQGPALSSPERATADEMFFAIGFSDLDEHPMIGSVDEAVRKARGGFNGVPEDDYRFKVPQLYNLVDANVFGHGGSFATVREVLEYKNLAEPQVNLPAEVLDPRFVSLNLSTAQLDDLTVFLEEALHDPDLMRYEPTTVPSGLCVINNDANSRVDLGCD